MKRQTILELVIFIVLVAVGVQVRVSLEHLPNFAPVAALALFAGYFFRSRMMAVAVPLSIMAISDQLIGGYAPWQMAVVYGMLSLPVLLGGVLRKHLDFSSRTKSGFAGSLAGLFGGSLAGSLLFFIVTNAVCLGWYEPTWAGVVQCYAQGLPFFRFTLYGDMLFALVTFGSYATIVSLIPSTQCATAWERDDAFGEQDQPRSQAVLTNT